MPPATYEPIATTTLTTDTGTVTFSSIPQTYTDLVAIIANVKNNFAGTGGVYDRFMRFNGDSGANYSVTNIQGNGSTASSNRFSNDNHFSASFPRASDQPGSFIVHIQNYANTTTNKTAIWRTTNPSVLTNAAVGLYRSTAAITSVTFIVDPNLFTSGSVFSIYGVKAA